MKRMLMIPCAMLLATPVLAQVNYTQSPAYKECTALAASNPTQALAKAEEWLKIDNGVAALHCRAMALYGLRRYEEAATALLQVRDSLPPEDITLRSYITQQAARAWVNGSRADAAFTTLSQQIDTLAKVRGNNALTAQLTAGLLLERAKLNVTYGKLTLATKDLDQAVSLTPLNEDILLERAGAFEQLGDVGLARADANAVLRLNAKNSKASELIARLDAKAATPAGAPAMPLMQAAPAAPTAPAH